MITMLGLLVLGVVLVTVTAQVDQGAVPIHKDLRLWTDLDDRRLPSVRSLLEGRYIPGSVNTEVRRLKVKDDELTRSIFNTHTDDFSTHKMLVVNCSVKLDVLGVEGDMACLCYDNVDLYPLHDCPHAIDRTETNILLAVIKQSVWRDAMLFTDRVSAMDTLLSKNPVFMNLGCDTSKLNMTHLFDMHYASNDYVNILIDCPHATTMDIMNRLNEGKKESRWKLKRSNYLLTTSGQLMNITTFAHIVFDGDNAGIVQYEPRTYSKRSLTQMLYRFDQRLPRPTFRIERCMSDCHKRESLMYVGRYDSAQGIMDREDKVVSAVFEQFYGRKIILAVGHYPPFYNNRSTTADGNHGGMGYEMVMLLSKKFNYSVEVVYTVDGKWGSTNADGTWNGMVGMVYYGVADLCLGGITISEKRRTAIDFTMAHHEENNVVLLNLPWSRWGFFYEVFSPKLWAAIVCMPMFAAIILWLIKVVCERKIFCHRDTTFGQIVYYSYGICMFQGASFTMKSQSGRFIFWFYWLTVIIILATYIGNLTATLAVRKVKLPFTTLQEIADKDEYILTIRAGSIRETLFSEAEEGSIYSQLWAKILRTPKKSYIKTTIDAIEKMTKDPFILYTADKTVIRNHMILMGSCSFVMLPEEYFPSTFGIGVRKGSPHIEHFNNAIMRVMELGLTKVWKTKYEIKDVCEDPTAVQTSGTSIAIGDTIWLFVLLAVGMGLSLVFLGIEACHRFRQKRRQKDEKHDELDDSVEMKANGSQSVRGELYTGGQWEKPTGAGVMERDVDGENAEVEIHSDQSGGKVKVTGEDDTAD